MDETKPPHLRCACPHENRPGFACDACGWGYETEPVPYAKRVLMGVPRLVKENAALQAQVDALTREVARIRGVYLEAEWCKECRGPRLQLTLEESPAVSDGPCHCDFVARAALKKTAHPRGDEMRSARPKEEEGA